MYIRVEQEVDWCPLKLPSLSTMNLNILELKHSEDVRETLCK